jgi:hypothetical protein
MTEWVIIGALDVSVLLIFRYIGGLGAAGKAFTDWGCAAGRVGPAQSSCD